MATSGSVFSETLNEITITKLEELSKRRTAFESDKASTLASVEAQGTNVLQRLIALNDGVKKCFGLKGDHMGGVPFGATIHTELKNLDRFVAQARNDPSILPATVTGWEERLRGHLDKQSLKYEYASLCAKLVNEWLSGDSKADGLQDVKMEDDGFETVDNAKRLEARLQWEKTVFEPASVDVPQFQSYLGSLFGVPKNGKSRQDDPEKKEVFRAWGKLRGQVKEFEREFLLPNQFNSGTLTWAINGLLSSGLLSNEKREVLKDFVGNPMILAEIADVLNMRMAALGSWTWGPGGVEVEQRRLISGVYNVHMHEDLLQAIFLQHIGVKWSIFFKDALKASFFSKQGVWKKSRSDVSQEARRRLLYYLGRSAVDMWPSVQTARRRLYRKGYMLSQLMENEDRTGDGVDGEEEAEYAQFESSRKRARQMAPAPQRMVMQQQMPMQQHMGQAYVPAGAKGLGRGGAKRYRRVLPEKTLDHFNSYEEDSDGNASDGEDDEYDDEIPASRMQLKQKLLHILSTEITMFSELTVVHSSFENWNPLLPHDTVLTVLKFLGVSEKWLKFFTTFLQAPLKFVGDNESGTTQIRRRGTPAAHVLSDVFGEVVLFCLDLSINQSTGGVQLWRVFDDCWFWSRDHQAAVTAWKTIQDFARAAGVSVDENKTGTARISRNTDDTLDIDKSLPEGQIRWGFLELSQQTGRFEIDQAMVDHHIKELQFQLQSEKNKKSVFAFIQTWNTYAATFFTSNFGKPSNCFGRAHVDEMLATHERIQRQVFAGLGDGSCSDVASYIKKTLHQRFGVENLPDGFLFFPVELGGLELKSTFIPLLLIRDSVLDSASKLHEKLAKSEQDAYHKARTFFLNGSVAAAREHLNEPDWKPDEVEERYNFMSFEEFTRYREEFRFVNVHYDAHAMFDELMESPSEEGIGLDTVRIGPALEKLRSQIGLQSIKGDFYSMKLYWSWVTMMYGPEVVDRFGGLNIVDPGLLPMGMVSLLRERKVTWQE